jgi:hypothetical protein
MITIADARRHWQDETAPCRVAMRARNQFDRWYWAHHAAPGRRWRGRWLARANQILHEIRCACPLCQQDVLWEKGFIGGNQGQCRKRIHSKGADYCRRCDLFIGYGALRVYRPPAEPWPGWRDYHCWSCRRSDVEIALADWRQGLPPPTDYGV